MSLVLSDAKTKPANLEVKTGYISKGGVHFGDYEVSMEDFLAAVEYVLTNMNLEPDDPRSQFVRCVRSMVEVCGWGGEGRRLQASVPVAYPKNLSQ